MGAQGQGKRWLVRVAIATVVLASAGILADPSHAMAADPTQQVIAEEATIAILVFALVWAFASLRMRRRRGRLRLGFEPAAVRITSGTRKSGGRSARAPGGISGGAGASGKF